jgi:hypothetical protein
MRFLPVLALANPGELVGDASFDASGCGGIGGLFGLDQVFGSTALINGHLNEFGLGICFVSHRCSSSITALTPGA